MSGGYIRTNFRRAGDAGFTAIGGGIPKASLYGGGGFTLPHGGFIMGSFSGVQGNNSIGFSAAEAMASWFGAGAFGDGYVIWPIAAWSRYASASGSGVSYAQIVPSVSYGSAPSIMFFHIYTSQSARVRPTESFSFHVAWAGFIVSSP